MKNYGRIGIIGCGNMGEAIAKGIIASRVATGSRMCLYDLDKGKTGRIERQLGAHVCKTSEELCRTSRAIILAVKPQDMKAALEEARGAIDASKLVISIAAGVTISRISALTGKGVRIVRVMPNMAAFVRSSVSAMCAGSGATAGDKEIVRKIFNSVGEVVEIGEGLMDAVTVITSSGLAYFFYLAEVLEECAVAAGLGRAKARAMVTKTALGSALLLADKDADAVELRRRVSSKGGTTEAAFRHFFENRLEEILRQGIEKAHKRAQELSGE